MDAEERKHLDALLSIYRRRLHQLEEQAAHYGLHPPAELPIEIEDLRAKIKSITASLQPNTPGTEHPIPPSRQPENLPGQHSDKEPQIPGLSGNVSSPGVPPIIAPPSPWRTFNVRSWVWLTIIVLISLLLSFLGGRQAAIAKLQPTIDALQKRSIAVDSTKDWQSTGFVIVSGDKVVIHVIGGKWTSWRKMLPENIRNQLSNEIGSKLPAETWLNIANENDGRGESRICAEIVQDKTVCPVQDFVASSLVAKIGDTKYGIGNSCEFTSMSNGELFLRINDDGLSDNSGILSIEVAIRQSSDNINSPNCGTPIH